MSAETATYPSGQRTQRYTPAQKHRRIILLARIDTPKMDYRLRVAAERELAEMERAANT